MKMNDFVKMLPNVFDNIKNWINEIFDKLDKLISKEEWYPKGGNKAQITPYTISKLMTLLPKGSDLDWISIWNKQTLYPAVSNTSGITGKINAFREAVRAS